MIMIIKLISTAKRFHFLHFPLNVSPDRCSYTATTTGNLKVHKEAKHEGIRYPCDQCPYSSVQLGDLKRHKLRKH